MPTLWVFLLPHLLLPFASRWWARTIALLPLAALAAIGLAAWWRGAVEGVWLAPWQLLVAALALALAFVGLGAAAPAAQRAKGGGQGGRRGRRAAPGMPGRR